jgi:nucleotidyltransferase/DNA polymerase involved in DNA repair
VRIKIRDHRFATVTRSVSLPVATTGTKTVYQVAGRLLDAWLAARPGTPVRLVGVGVSGLQSTQGKGEGLDTALDQIADRYGEDTITRGLAMRRPDGGK